MTPPARPHPGPAPSTESAREAGLRYVTDAEPGIRRRRHGRGFIYRASNGKVVSDARTLARIRALAIPPAYTDVWICNSPRGHLQATGRDARGRKQYRYHARWKEVRDAGKFDRIVAFGRALPRLRRHLRADLDAPGLPREKVLAIVVSLMAETLVRVGNETYARGNRSYGLTTLRNRHIAFLRKGRARLRFKGKGGQVQLLEFDDPRLVKLIRSCQELPGQPLFQYRDEDGDIHPVDSGAVNDYLQDVMDDAFTAKDFRTWGATLLAFRLFADTPLPQGSNGKPPSARALAQVQNEVVANVAESLGNTPAVCRKAYVDPAVLAGWQDGSLARAAGKARGARQWERATLAFLKSAHRGSGMRAT